MGYVGRHLTRYLSRKGFDVYPVGRGSYPIQSILPGVHPLPPADLLNYAECENLVQNVDYIFNLAADVGGIGHIQSHKAAGYASATINTNLLRAIVETKTQLQGYFLASSSCVYGEDEDVKVKFTASSYPSAEEKATFATASEGYGQAKFYAEKTCAAFKQEHGVPVRIARYHSVYGPGESRRGKEHFIESLVNKMAIAKNTGDHEITIWGDGTQRRSLLYIDDCVEGTVRIMFSQCSEPLNLAHTHPVSVNRVVSELEELAGIQVARFYNTEAAVGVKNKTAWLGTLRDTLGWEPRVGVQEGLRQTWNDRWTMPS